MSTVDLERCYREVAEVLDGRADSLDAVRIVDQHRRFWRPQRPKVILLAESHVFTHLEELRPMDGCGTPGFQGLPDTYARFVYCLGYGENRFVGTNVSGNGGTPQFWKILWSCLHRVDQPTDFSPILVSRSEYSNRLATKRSLLEELRERGVWLVDASPVALYAPGRVKPSPVQLGQAIRLGWDRYVSSVIREAAPRSTVVIGSGVARSLGNRLDDATEGRHVVVSQPQARLTSAQHAAIRRMYFEVCIEAGV